MDFSEKGLKSLSDKDFTHFQKVKLQPVQSINKKSWNAQPDLNVKVKKENNNYVYA